MQRWVIAVLAVLVVALTVVILLLLSPVGSVLASPYVSPAGLLIGAWVVRLGFCLFLVVAVVAVVIGVGVLGLMKLVHRP